MSTDPTSDAGDVLREFAAELDSWTGGEGPPARSNLLAYGSAASAARMRADEIDTAAALMAAADGGTATPSDVADVLSRPWMARDSRVLDAAGRELFLIHNVENWRHDQVATWLVDLVNVAATPGEVGPPPSDQASADLRSLRRASLDVLDEIDRTGDVGEDAAVVGRLRDALSRPAAATPGEPSPPADPSACCDEENPDTGYRCRRTPIHDAGKSIRKHVQIDKLGYVGWWITPARALLSGGEQS